MSNPELSESIELSQDFFTDHSSYAPFDLTSDKKTIVDCIEPRDAEDVPHGEYKVTVQTGGGGSGEGLDAAVALTIIGGEVATVEEGMSKDKVDRPQLVLGVHHDCTYMKHLADVTAEMRNPSDFTKDTVDRYSRYFNEREHVERTLGGVMIAVAGINEYLGERKHIDSLIAHADDLYPEHANVKHVRGPGLSRTYVTNLHPFVGKNRNMKPCEPEEAIKIQGHHDSIAASVNLLRGANQLDSQTRGYRFTSMLLRSAATRTVVTGGWDEATLLEVRPAANSKSGLKISEQKLT